MTDEAHAAHAPPAEPRSRDGRLAELLRATRERDERLAGLLRAVDSHCERVRELQARSGRTGSFSCWLGAPEEGRRFFEDLARRELETPEAEVLYPQPDDHESLLAPRLNRDRGGVKKAGPPAKKDRPEFKQ